MDTSALTKLLIAEPETPELRAWLTAQSDQGEYAATSALGRVELMRAVARYGEPGQAERARYLLDGLDILPLTEPVIALAETIGPPTLRSLDAIHLAAAAQIERELTAFVTYDRRLVDGCREVGLTTASPGALRERNPHWRPGGQQRSQRHRGGHGDERQ
jgi:predicted nucleic acid-binding protein